MKKKTKRKTHKSNNKFRFWIPDELEKPHLKGSGAFGGDLPDVSLLPSSEEACSTPVSQQLPLGNPSEHFRNALTK